MTELLAILVIKDITLLINYVLTVQNVIHCAKNVIVLGAFSAKMDFLFLKENVHPAK